MEDKEKLAANTLANFEKQIKRMARTNRVGTNDQAYRSYPYSADAVDSVYFQMKEVLSTLIYGDPDDLRELSKFYYRYSGIYKRTLIYYANLLLFDFVLMPHQLNKIA